MDMIDQLNELAARAEKLLPHLKTEEATKTAFVMPFIQALGYDVFNPSEVVPEFTADVGIKKGEKVDYAIHRDGTPIILFECKTAGTDLERVTPSQLYRYFSVTDARFGVLTDGIEYHFFTDLESPNKMDSRPFLEFSLLSADEVLASELKKFAKQTFDVDEILVTASDLKYTKGIKRSLADEWTNPSEDFIRLFCGRVYSGRFTQAVRDQFAEIVKRAFQEFVTDRINLRLQTALAREDAGASQAQATDVGKIAPSSDEDRVVTTEEEVEAYYAVKAILREVIDPNRIFIRDTQSYCGILLDDNNRKPICRLFMHGRHTYLGLLDAEKKMSRHRIDNVNDIYRFSPELVESAKRYCEDEAAEAVQ